MAAPTISGEDFKQGMEGLKIAADLFTSVVGEITQLKKFKELADGMEKELGIYSEATAKAVSNAYGAMLASEFSYREALLPVFNWCTQVISLRKFLATSGQDQDFARFSKAIMAVCSKGITLIETGLGLLKVCEAKLGEAKVFVKEVIYRLENDASTESEWYTKKFQSLRAEGYGSAAAASLIGFPFGAIFAFSITAAVVEVKIAEMENILKMAKNKFAELHTTMNDTSTSLNVSIDRVIELKKEFTKLHAAATATNMQVEILSTTLNDLNLAFTPLVEACAGFIAKYEEKM